MNLLPFSKNWAFLLGSCVFMVSCGGDAGNGNNGNTVDSTAQTINSAKANDPSVMIHNLGDPDRLNPLTSSSANSTYIQNQIFSRLLEYDPKTLELIPQTAVARPVPAEINEGPFAGGMSLTYEIRPEATWDNGTPITAEDYIFTVKALKNPKVNSGPQRPYYEFIDDIQVDAANPKKFTIFSKKRYFLAESASGDFFILPEYVYDPKKIMRGFTIPQLNDPKTAEKLNGDAKINEFATEFNSSKYDRETGFVVGSGPYTFTKWETGQSVVLDRKKDWWGDKVQGVPALQAYSPQLVYKIITDMNTAITVMKDEGIDAMTGIKPEAYKDLFDDQKFKSKFELTTPDQFAYYYLGFNMKDPRFSDKRVRLAVAHLMNRDDIIDNIFYGMAVKTNSPVNPKKPYYNKNLPDIKFDTEKAKSLLEEAGWKDTDNDGIRDKVVNGKKMSLKVQYKYNQGNTIRKNIGLLLKDEAQRVGIEVEVVAREWTVLLEDMKKRDFELICMAWVQGPGLDDLKQIWHTDSDSPDGSNRVGFGNAESDKVIDEIRYTLDETKRNELYYKIQEIIYNEQPYVFICVPSERIAIHRRFENRFTSALRPGFKENWFKLSTGASNAQ